MLTFTEAQILDALAAFLLPFFRLLGIFTAAPVLSARSLPVRVRIGAAFLVALIAAPLAGRSPPSFSDPDIWAMMAAEIMIGLAIGLVARLMLSAVELAGETIGLQMGLGFAGFFDPATGGTGNAVGRLLAMLSLAAFVAADGPSLIIAATVQSIQSMPPGSAGGGPLQHFDLAGIATTVFQLGLLIALPYMALLLFVNLALGVVSRVAPQLNVFAIGFPVTIGAGLVLLAIGLPLMGQPFQRVLAAMMSAIGI